MKQKYQYKAISGLTSFLKFLLLAGIAMALLNIGSSVMEYELLGRENFSDQEAEQNDKRENLVTLARVVLVIVIYVVFGIWIVRANKNARALGAKNLSASPGWALGYFFVPILNLWKPFKAMNELWHASHDPRNGKMAFKEKSQVVLRWWGVYFIWFLPWQLANKSWDAAETLEQMQKADLYYVGAAIFEIVLCVFSIALISKIAIAQENNDFGPPVDSRVKVTNGKHKGKFGIVVANDGRNITIEDRSGRKLVLPKHDFKL